MENFFQRLQRVHNPPLHEEKVPVEETSEFKAIARHYVHFCQSRINRGNPAMILKDLRELMGIPEITHIAFRESEESFELMLGTKHVYITDPCTGKEHSIGEFIILINRKNKLVRLCNITSPMSKRLEGGEIEISYHHPHINSRNIFCMASGKDILDEYLTEGQISPAVRMLVRALHTVDEGQYPDARIEYWPLKEGQ